MNKNGLQQFANCIAGAVVWGVSAPFLAVMSYRTLTLFEIRNDNLQVTVIGNFKISPVKVKIEKKIIDFFNESSDYNGMPLRDISREFDIDYKISIDIVKELVVEDKVSIQSSTNPTYNWF